MKLKRDFVTNSSSTSFIICNTSNQEKSLVDFVKENPQLIEEFKQVYDYLNNPRFSQENLIKSAEENNILFKSGKKTHCIFGDEQGTLIGLVFDYILRDGGMSENFIWNFDESLR